MGAGVLVARSASTSAPLPAGAFRQTVGVV